MSAAWPVVRARLAAHLPTILPAGTAVYDGPVLTGDSPAAYVTVAHRPSVEDESAGEYSQDRTPITGYVAEETGTVLLEVAAVSGNPDMPSAFGLVAAIQSWVQNDQTLGVLTPGSAAALSVEVLQDQNQAGAVQRLLVTLSYFTRLERNP